MRLLAPQPRAARLTASSAVSAAKSSCSQPRSRLHCRSSASCAGLDRGLVPFLPPFAYDYPVGRQQALLDQQIDERRRLGRNIGASGDASAGASAFRVDAGEPRDEPSAQQNETKVAITGNATIRIGSPQSTLDGGFDGATDAAKGFIIGKLEGAAAAIVEVELLQREGEERQRVAAAALIDVFKQPLRQSRLDGETAIDIFEPRSRTFDHCLIRAAWHRQQRHGSLASAFERFCRFQQIVGIGADRKQREHRRAILLDEITDDFKKHLAFPPRPRRQTALQPDRSQAQ